MRTTERDPSREPRRTSRDTRCLAGALAAACTLLLATGNAAATELRGEVASGGEKLGSTPVNLYRAGSAKSGPERLGQSRTGRDGAFAISYREPKGSKAVLYLTAGKGQAVRLASVLGVGGAPRKVVVNEHTTVAMGYALAQFLTGGKRIAGSSPGLQNAAAMAANLANPRNGNLSGVLRRAPNGDQTSTLQKFNSVSNMLPRCARSQAGCSLLFSIAKPPGGSAPRGTLEAVADIARNPGHGVKRLFRLAGAVPTPYRPALAQDEQPDSWTLALSFDGDGKSLDGPGNFAIDRKGNIWVNSNYQFQASPHTPACASGEVFKFTPDGRYAKGSPYSGGGLDGAGFGISIDPDGHVWVGNYGFKGVGCTIEPAKNSVSEFLPSGKPLSPSATATSTGGYTQGLISGAQATVPDRNGTMWIANCDNDTVTRYPGGDPNKATVSSDLGISSPFGIAINDKGQAFVTGNASDSVAMLNPDGTPTANSPISGAGINLPLGIATDSRGKIWIANSSAIAFPCNAPQGPFDIGGSATLLSSDGVPSARSPYTGGGLKVPWGIAVDGDDNVWVANFDGQQIGELCGTRPRHCPPGARTGDPIAPASGYGSDALTRNTGIAVDPSGNVWLANNWLQTPYQTNPGGHEIVAFVGAAAPVQTPVIGPPER
ncbi:MAG: hypothetical protein KDB58_12905 [Solirubrobacterales bacterium]|nr:hypothetical protein [Solirubrobacterales bacterium]MCB8970019.1 hypothetical protein [Thermoleophilales bacterium]MCO5326970.1 hypothetical protein [Solirubrobacterales bacterium]